MNKSQEKIAARAFDLMLKEYLNILEHGEEVLDQKSGEVVRVRPSAAKLRVIQRFLEQHQIGRASANDNPVAQIISKQRSANPLRLAGSGSVRPPGDDEAESA